ncbi:MAG: hypothetical protein LC791_13120, partial [Acidobacteria bacterium]|nr:hypothetical protein [Acidobacteriota bacterium]
GDLFGHLRQGRSFWHAAWISMGPFALVHLLLFVTMPWPIAAASVALAVVSSFPVAYLFELAHGSVWPPALLHFSIQAGAKMAIPDEAGPRFALVWMMASAVIPFAAFLVPRHGTPERLEARE